MAKQRKIVAIFMALVLMLLAACSSGATTTTTGGGTSGDTGGKTETPASGGDSKEQITLRLLWWGSQTRHDLTNEVIKLYEKKNPHVKIQGEFTSYNGYWEKLAAMVAGNNMPDVLQMNYGEYLTQYAGKDVLADLTPFTESGAIKTDKISKGLLESGKPNDKLLGIPLGMNALTVIYDEQMLKDAGAKLPDSSWTWDDWKQIAETVHQKTGNYGTQGLEIVNIFEYYARQNGQKIFNADKTGLGFEEKTLADFLTMVLEQQEKGTYPTLDVILQHEAVEDQLIVHKKAPFDFRWSNQVVALTKAAQRPLKLAPLPGPDLDKGMYLKPAMFFSMSKNSKHQEEAAKFIDFFINDVEANKILNGERGVPVSSDIRKELSGSLDETNKMVYEYIDMIAQNSSPIDGNYPAGSSEVLKALEEVHEQVMYKQISPEEGAKEFKQRAEDIIEREAKK
ncbi:ABC transporter substrate-binding protein [Paenibacillus turpanensis]|uniref:ABC transporter substrate-binding protein n=1 Tax=Paenibacillus turpanensis TaxID=2689078 RepID=UPI00140CED21|nr:sugar ABC transporter substrate-binding protein [Paenibacillus turpanensis]